jgi:hypothetical protein
MLDANQLNSTLDHVLRGRPDPIRHVVRTLLDGGKAPALAEVAVYDRLLSLQEIAQRGVRLYR